MFVWFEEMKEDQKLVIEYLCDFLYHPLSGETSTLCTWRLLAFNVLSFFVMFLILMLKLSNLFKAESEFSVAEHF